MSTQINAYADPFGVWHVEISTDRFEIDRKTARHLAKSYLQFQLDDRNASTVAAGYKVKFDRRIIERESHTLNLGPAQYWQFTERSEALPHSRQREALAGNEVTS